MELPGAHERGSSPEGHQRRSLQSGLGRGLPGDVSQRPQAGESLSSPSFSLSFTLAPPLQGYMWKKGHVRRNWTERWFVLKPSSIEYFVSEDLKDKRGEVKLDKDCVVEVGQREWKAPQKVNYDGFTGLIVLFLHQPVSDRDGKRCMFCVKTHSKTFEISASDQKQKVEWIQGSFQSNLERIRLLWKRKVGGAYLPHVVVFYSWYGKNVTSYIFFQFHLAVQTALRLQGEGKSSLHHELKLKRRWQREHSRSARSSCSSQSSQSDDSNHQEMAKMEKGKDRQDLEIESIIQVGQISEKVIQF